MVIRRKLWALHPPLYSKYQVAVFRESNGWRWICFSCPKVRGRYRGGLHKHYRFSARPYENLSTWQRCIRAANFHVHKDHLYRQ